MLSARWLLLLISGGVERKPGPRTRGAQCGSGGLSQTKRLVLERKLLEDMVFFRLLQGTRAASVGRHAIKIGGYQRVEQARTPRGGGASISVLDGVGVEVGVLEKKVPERATLTLRFSANASLTIKTANFQKKDRRFQRVAGHLVGARGSLVEGADANSHHVARDPLRPSGGKGECIVDWCVQNGLPIANAGSASRRQPARPR
ncbi:hypothetical protein ERJ75_001534000 [Trypanosoma vivax]|nr:hypothetical protein ERJ75_001534000 [Trypanosoma vivax]